MMRQILVDYARRHSAAKRGSDNVHFSLDDVQIPVEERVGSVLALDEALERLEEFNETQSKIVEMKFFGGMTNSKLPNLSKSPKAPSFANGGRRVCGFTAN